MDDIDAIVMLTWSDWFTEMRSNRYHYATRFARYYPVIFVQPDLTEVNYYYQETEIENIIVLHIYNNIYSDLTTQLLNRALLQRGIINPLLWIYNTYFIDFIQKKPAAYKVYHATEDYFSDNFFSEKRHSGQLKNDLVKTLSIVDLVVYVSDGVKESYNKNSIIKAEQLVLTNGCDFNFYAPSETMLTKIINDRKQSKIVLFQGGINSRVNIKLLNSLAMQMPDWKFVFAGKITEGLEEWTVLQALDNVEYIGFLSPDKLRNQMYQSSIGIIPYVENDLMIKSSLPLKAYEYLAAGLPVVSIPIESLKKYSDIFYFARTVEEFENTIRECYKNDTYKIAQARIQVASTNTYDRNFIELINVISPRIACKSANKTQPHYRCKKLNILILYDDSSVHVNTITEHLLSFQQYSMHNVYYAKATGQIDTAPELALFDVVVLHYCIRVSLRDHLSAKMAVALEKYNGLKVLFIQDEYDTTETARQWIEKLGIQCVYTCVPKQYLDYVYPKKRFPNVIFLPTLTGYVSDNFIRKQMYIPHSERPYGIVYRGRCLPYWYGSLGQEKERIGLAMKEFCLERQIPVDIETDDSKRIYGDAWHEFLQSGRATLGTESGSNLFDFDGEIKASIEAALKNNPNLTYKDAVSEWIDSIESNIKMNQISPKIFEAISLHTALILFEGEYSGVVEPNKHYIPLKKDFSNIDEVLTKLSDCDYLHRLTQQAYEDVVLSGKYSYQQFIQNFDTDMCQFVLPQENYHFLAELNGYINITANQYLPLTNSVKQYLTGNTRNVQNGFAGVISSEWINQPASVARYEKINAPVICDNVREKLNEQVSSIQTTSESLQPSSLMQMTDNSSKSAPVIQTANDVLQSISAREIIVYLLQKPIKPRNLLRRIYCRVVPVFVRKKVRKLIDVGIRKIIIYLLQKLLNFFKRIYRKVIPAFVRKSVRWLIDTGIRKTIVYLLQKPLNFLRCAYRKAVPVFIRKRIRRLIDTSIKN